MIAGLPWGSWLLLLASVGVGLGIQVAVYVGRRDGRRHDLRAGRGRPPVAPPTPGRRNRDVTEPDAG